MLFDLVKPCKDCPFRTDVKPYLTRGRVEDILFALAAEQRTFTCHKTVDYTDGTDEDEGFSVPRYDNPNEQHCAGAMILLEKIKRPNQLMRIAERLNCYNRHKLRMDSPVYDSPDAMVQAYSGEDA